MIKIFRETLKWQRGKSVDPLIKIEPAKAVFYVVFGGGKPN